MNKLEPQREGGLATRGLRGLAEASPSADHQVPPAIAPPAVQVDRQKMHVPRPTPTHPGIAGSAPKPVAGLLPAWPGWRGHHGHPGPEPQAGGGDGGGRCKPVSEHRQALVR